VLSILEELQKIHNYPTGKYGGGYYPDYCFHFDPVRNKIKTILEIGVDKGGSMEMWKDYFPNAVVIGVDIYKVGYTPSDPRVHLEVGDATNPQFVSCLIEKYQTFDIVLDDGSHKASQMKKSFDLFWPATIFIYCIEDLLTQYVKFFEGKYVDAISMIEHLKEMIDFINTTFDKKVGYKALCFHKMQCYIYKKLTYEE
jgi:hypothetical protein